MSAKISCSAADCIYNVQSYCSKNGVQIGGMRAHSSEQTTCGSFVSKRGAEELTACNSSSCACNDHTQIQCAAKNCKYNEQSHCQLNEIQVRCECVGSGDNTTCCDSFCDCD